MGDRDVAATAVQLWKALQDRYGLKPAYDSGLVEEIRATLGLPDGPMPTALRRQGVTNEQLLHAVLLSLQPLAAMLADLLRLFERAKATMADKQNLRVSYDFGSRRPPLDVDLDQFREWTRRTTHAVGRAGAIRWEEGSMWDLAGLLGGTAGTAEATLRPDVREWLATYDSQGWPSRVPVVEPTGRAGLDQLLRRVGAIAASMLGQCRSVSADRTDLRDRYFGQGERPRPLDETELSEVLARVDANNWLRQIVVLVETTADRARTDPAFDTSGLVREAAARLDSLPTTTVTTRTLQAALEEILSLPAWQLRHEVYAAWVLTRRHGKPEALLAAPRQGRQAELFLQGEGKPPRHDPLLRSRPHRGLGRAAQAARQSDREGAHAQRPSGLHPGRRTRDSGGERPCGHRV